MPPQGLLTVAAYLPKRWQVRFIDENIERAGLSDFAWADVVFVGGMHIQLSEVRDIQRRAKSSGKLTVLGETPAPKSLPNTNQPNAPHISGTQAMRRPKSRTPLTVRGYLGITLLGQSQIWKRLSETDPEYPKPSPKTEVHAAPAKKDHSAPKPVHVQGDGT